MNKKNIMIIIGKMKTGGAERTVMNLCNLLRNNYNVTLVVRTMEEADYIPNVNIIEIPKLGFENWILFSAVQLKKLKRELKIDTTISFLLKYNLLNILSKGKDKVIISTRNYLSLTANNYDPRVLKLYYKLVNKTDLIVNTSREVMYDQIVNYHAKEKKNIVIPNYVIGEEIDKRKIEPLTDEDKKMFTGKVIISPGRYSFQKGHWHLIRAFKEVVNYDKDAKLILVSRGNLKEYLENLVNNLGLEKNVFLLDYSNNIYSYLYNSDLFVLSSFYEGMPNVVLEAMQCGLPIIATDSPGGTKDIISPRRKENTYVSNLTMAEYGILVPNCDMKFYDAITPLTKEEVILKDAIIKLLSDKELYNHYKMKSTERIKDYQKDKILSMWEKVI